MAKVNTNVPALWQDTVTSVRTSTEGPLYELGQYREENGRGYRYVKYDGGAGSIAAVAGQIAFYLGDTNDTTEGAANTFWEVTSDVSDSHRNKVAGVLTAVIADEGYGWLQTRGPASVVFNNDDDAAEGMSVISANTDGTCDTVAAGTAPTNQVVGWVIGAVVAASNTAPCFLTLD